MKRLFGTDGIRAVAGEHPLDPATVRKFGAALARTVRIGGDDNSKNGVRVLFGRDTRESGPWLRDAVATGLQAQGAEAVDAGVITTPGLAALLRRGGFQAGIMISASHNPFEDNGLKAFDAQGVKLCDEMEQRIEAEILDGGVEDCGADDSYRVTADPALAGAYVRELESLLPAGRFKGLKLLLDGSNGASSELAPQIFRDYGAKVDAIGVSPDGRNINLNCGSLHLDGLAERVLAGNYDIGIAFDGDADRCLAVDAKGRTIDGDHILYLCGRGLKRKGQLRGNALVATIMSNFWLESYLKEDGIELHRAPVGDKYVLQRMVEEDLVLGGEQSGHIIFRDHATTGDGMLTGMILLDTLLDEPKSLVEILDGIRPSPQVLLNVRVGEKPDLRKHATIGPIVSEIENQLEGTGRVVLRYSGTEPVARVMVEGPDEATVESLARRLASSIEGELGG